MLPSSLPSRSQNAQTWRGCTLHDRWDGGEWHVDRSMSWARWGAGVMGYARIRAQQLGLRAYLTKVKVACGAWTDTLTDVM